MRTISEIKKDIQTNESEYRNRLKVLTEEIEKFQSACPHPDNMVKVTHKDYDDDGPGVPRYDYTVSTAFCLCCEKKVHSKSYRKNVWEPREEKKFKEMLKTS